MTDKNWAYTVMLHYLIVDHGRQIRKSILVKRQPADVDWKTSRICTDYTGKDATGKMDDMRENAAKEARTHTQGYLRLKLADR